MDKERIKTLFLVGLFLISIFLANEIWIELPSIFLPSFTEDLDEEYNKYSVSDIISPEKILVNFNTSSNTILYSDVDNNLWNEGKKIIIKLFESDKLEQEEIGIEEFRKYREVKSLDYYFPEEIHVHLLSKVIDANMPKYILDNIDSINDIHINLGKDTFVVLSNGDKHIKLTATNIKVQKMRKIINDIGKETYTKFVAFKDILPIENEVYIPINMNYKLPEIQVRKEIDVKKIKEEELDSIVEKFFDKDPNYVRRIEENNGTKIYIYNQQMLKIYNDGMIEYLNSLEKTVRNRELYKSLDKAINFISNHIGWPENAYLKSIEPIEKDNNKGYKFEFSYKVNGAEILFDKEEHSLDQPIEIKVFNEQITSYKRYVKVQETTNSYNINLERMLTLLETLEKKNNLEYIKEEFKEYIKQNTDEDIESLSEIELNTRVLSAISDIYIGYRNSDDDWIYGNERLEPVWVIKIEGIDKKFQFDIYSN